MPATLTGLRNRAYLSEVLGVEFERAQRYGIPLSVAMAVYAASPPEPSGGSAPTRLFEV